MWKLIPKNIVLISVNPNSLKITDVITPHRANITISNNADVSIFMLFILPHNPIINLRYYFLSTLHFFQPLGQRVIC